MKNRSKKWKDVSSYSQRDAVRSPSNYELKSKFIRVHVHRHTDWPKDAWLLSCDQLGVIRYDLRETNLQDAQDKAILLIKSTLKAFLRELENT